LACLVGRWGAQFRNQTALRPGASEERGTRDHCAPQGQIIVPVNLTVRMKIAQCSADTCGKYLLDVCFPPPRKYVFRHCAFCGRQAASCRCNERGRPMLRRVVCGFVVVLATAGLLTADEKKKEEGIKGKIVKVDATKNTITIKTDSGNKTFTLTDDTKYIGPRGGVSEAGIKDDRIAVGNEVRIVTAKGGKTAQEVHLSYRGRSGKDKSTKDKDK